MSPSSAPKQLAVLRPGINYGLRTAQRHITTVDAASGQSVITPQEVLLYCDRGGYSVSWNYATNAFPADLADDKDLKGFLSDDTDAHNNSVLYTGSRIVNDGGITFNTTNFAPDTETVMHRTLSLDFVTVVEGIMELELDSGEKVVLQAGVSDPPLLDLSTLKTNFPGFYRSKTDQPFVAKSVPGQAGTDGLGDHTRTWRHRQRTDIGGGGIQHQRDG